MSMVSQVRARVPRTARAAVERTRLTVVPARRVRAPRTPFAVLVLGLLAAGVVGLLMFNTQMQQASFHATALEQRADALVARQQSLTMELARLRDPQRLAHEAKKLGMVAPSVPAFLRLSDGAVVGRPTPATLADVVPIISAPPAKPAKLTPPPIVITVKPHKPGGSAGSGSHATRPRAGTNGGQAAATTGASR